FNESQLFEIFNKGYEFVRLRYEMPNFVQVERQGYFERGKRMHLALTDTGGETKYVEEQALALAKMGFCVTVVNQGGVEHPHHHDVREGLHYKADFVDVLFVNDGNEFVKKENTMPVYDFNTLDENNRPPVLLDGVYTKLAQQVALAMDERPVKHVLGHYICGAMVGYEFYKLREGTDQEIPTLPGFLIHSLGAVKLRRVIEAKEPLSQIATYNLERRIETEKRLIQSGEVFLYPVSKELHRSVEEHYGAMTDGFFPAAVDPRQFYPRGADIGKNHKRYNNLYIELALDKLQITGRFDTFVSRLDLEPDMKEALKTASRGDSWIATLKESYGIEVKDIRNALSQEIEELQRSFIVTETSRTVPTKGKDGVIKSFAHALKKSGRKDMQLVINIADFDKDSSAAESSHIEKLHQLVAELKLEENIIFRPSFDNSDVALIDQIAEVFLSDASMETWGMSVQQAAACRSFLICSDKIPFATEEAGGEERQVIEVELSLKDDKTVKTSYEMTQGCVIFPQGDSIAAGEALYQVVTQSGNEEFIDRIESMKDYARTQGVRLWDDDAKSI
ncbi:MAG: glycosyltransferase, partial [Bdellovibrionales bacterium]|nr:glycosyltransferase [Bdellovibrionales bacterium]